MDCVYARDDLKVDEKNFKGDKYFLEYLDYAKQRLMRWYVGNLTAKSKLDVKRRERKLAHMRNFVKMIVNGYPHQRLMRLSMLLNIIKKEGAEVLEAYLYEKTVPTGEYYFINRPQWIVEVECVIENIKILHTRKNHDYSQGWGNDDALANFLMIVTMEPNFEPVDEWTQFYDIALSFIWRMADKVARMKSFVIQGKLMVEDDSFEDAIRDYFVYLGLFYAFIKRVIDYWTQC